MEGIITGIGDKELGKNLIKPEYDAVINDFIIGKNTILEGLELNGNNLSAGTCILCGYRGIIDTPKELDTTAYVYGEFTLNSIYGGSGEDDFNIVTSDTALNEIEYIVNPTEITSAGTYYLLLYENGEKKVDLVEENGITKEVGEYPLKSYYSAETENVLDNAVIAPTATTPTETKTITNELGEEETVIATDLHLSQPNRVANTEYVHNQIAEEIDGDVETIELRDQIGGLAYYLIKLSFYHRAKYVYVNLDSITYNVGSGSSTTAKLPSKFIPNKYLISAICAKENGTIMAGGKMIEIKTDGTVSAKNVTIYDSSGDAITPEYESVSSYFSMGYQCQ